MLKKYILALDQGTTGSRAIILDTDLHFVSMGYREFKQIYPKPGWVEHDPVEIWNSTCSAVEEALQKAEIKGKEIAAIGITNQRETTILWDRENGEGIHNAIVWQCRRTEDYCKKLKKAGKEALVQNRAGLLIDPYFSATKIKWLLDNTRNARKRAEGGELAFGTVDSYLLWQLTGGEMHLTDVSNASRTMLYNIHTLDWDNQLLTLFSVPKSVLPQVQSSAGLFGVTSDHYQKILPPGIPIAGIAGDQQAALFGQGCFAPGSAKCTFGTGTFMLLNTGEKAVKSKNKLLTTIAWQLDGKTTYALEGSAFIAGAAVQWLRDGVGIIKSAPEIETLAKQVEDTGGLYFVPALAGLGAPHWRPEARGVITGLTRASTAGHIARAVLEGIALQNTDILLAMQKDSGQKLSLLKVDGGATANSILMQFQADILGVTIRRPPVIETTALGAGALAGLGVGIFKNLKEVQQKLEVKFTEFKPKMKSQTRKEKLAGWVQAVKKA